MVLEVVEKDEGKSESTGFSLELMANNGRPSPLEGTNFSAVQIPILADGKQK
jgi:hypothetical protein